MPPQQAVVLAAVGQGREVGAQVALGIAIEVLLTGELHPLPEDGQRQHLAAAQRGRGAGAVGLRGQVGLAEGVDQDIDCNQEGVHIHRVLLSWETDESYLPYGSGHLPVSRGHSMPRLTHTKRSSPGLTTKAGSSRLWSAAARAAALVWRGTSRAQGIVSYPVVWVYVVGTCPGLKPPG